MKKVLAIMAAICVIAGSFAVSEMTEQTAEPTAVVTAAADEAVNGSESEPRETAAVEPEVSAEAEVQTEATPAPETPVPDCDITPEPLQKPDTDEEIIALPDAPDTDVLSEVVNGDYEYGTNEDGLAEGVTSDSAMFKIVSCKLTAKGCSYTATIALSGTGYTKLYVGSAEKAESAANVYEYFVDENGKYAFTIPVPVLDSPFTVSAFGVKSGKWYERKITISSAVLPEEAIVPEKDVNDGEYDLGTDSDSGLANGVTTDSAMFKVVSCSVRSAGNGYTAVITLSGTGYSKLALGPASNAENAVQYDYHENSEGKYVFEIPFPAFDTPVAVSAYAVKSSKWYDRTITISSSALPEEAFAGETPAPTATPTPTPMPTADNSGTTSGVDSTTTLADGTYKPDSFSWSGGSGRLKGITCSKITVRNGKAYATIVIQSGKYAYVKASGGKYNCSRTADTSTVEIPVKLNAKNRILGCTVAMSVPHEVAYSIYVGLDAAKQTTDTTVTIGGVTFTRDANFGTDLLKVYHKDAEDLIYVEGAGYYFLTAPTGEVPEGMEDEASIITRPAGGVYVSSENAIVWANENEAAGIGAISELPGECAWIAEKVDAGEIRQAGAPNTVDYKMLLLNGCKLAIINHMETDSESIEYLEMLGITLFHDRSMEESASGNAEQWKEAYKLIFKYTEDM